MNIELISIGSELLTGKTVNTNAAYIGDALLKAGYKLSHMQTIVDTKKEITEALLLATKRSDLVITTGGLGPTGDDITKACLAEYAGVGMEHHPEIEARLAALYPHLPGNEDQATYPQGAILLENPIGTAYGIILRNAVVSLPGVPSQMKAIFQQGVLPWLAQTVPPMYVTKTAYITGKIESDIDPTLRALEHMYPGIEIGICPSWGKVSVYCVGREATTVDACMGKIREAFGNDVYSEEHPAISAAVHELLLEKELTLSCAESCSGGYVSSLCTRHAGASGYFSGAVVAYANTIKQKVLGVRLETLRIHGAVSEETATEMALGIKRLFGTSIGLATTGIAGPDGGTEEKPVGTVWVAVVDENDMIHTHQLKKTGDRQKIIEYAAHTALELIWRSCR